MKRLLLTFSWLPALALGQSKAPTVIATVKVDGPGYFRLGFDGEIVYSRQLNLVIDQKGRLADKNGGYLVPAMHIPKVEGTFDMNREGWVKFGDTDCGRVVIAVFENDGLLEKSGNYFTSPRRPKLVNPAPSGDGTIMVIANYNNPHAAKQTGTLDKEVKSDVTDRTKPAPKDTKLPGQFPKKVEGFTAARSTERGYPATPLITVRPLSEVDGDTFRLSDIADVAAEPVIARKLGQVQIGNTPYFGVERKLDLSYLRTMLKAAGFDPTQVEVELAAETRVVRAGQTLTTDQVVNAAILEAETKFGANGQLIAVQKPSTIRAPKGSLTLRCSQCLEGADGIRVVFDIYVNDRRFNSTSVQLRREGGVPKLVVGATVRVIASAGSLSVETTGRVTKILRNGREAEVKTAEGTLLVGRVLPDGSVEVQ